MTCKNPREATHGGGNPFREVLEGPQMRNLNRHMGRELRPVLISVRPLLVATAHRAAASLRTLQSEFVSGEVVPPVSNISY